MKKHRSASGITAFNSMIFAAGGKNNYNSILTFLKLKLF